MLFSLILAWVSVLLCLLEAFRFIARVSKAPKLNRIFHKCHIPFGVLLLVTGGVHGILAGNLPGASLAEIEIAPVFLTLNWGTACFLCGMLLAVSYLLRKKLRRWWMAAHRLLTVLMLAFLVLHVVDMGISLPARLAWGNPPTAEKPFAGPSAPVSSAEPSKPAAEPTARPDPSPSRAPEEETSSAAGTPEPSPSPETPSQIPETSAPPDEDVLADGVYQGSAQGRNGPITVEVTVEGGAIADIEVISQSETPRYYEQAEAVISSILSAGSPDVDAVTGATISSEAIKAAVAAALGL